jgi:hypothetical protein
MGKTTCKICQLFKKPKFFPAEQPYPDAKVCDKCIDKNAHRNNTMISMLERKTGIKPSDEERSKISLSFDTAKEVKHISNTEPKMGAIIQDLADCRNRDFIMEKLNELPLSDSTKAELVEHFLTVAGLNYRAKLIHENKQRAEQGLAPLTKLEEKEAVMDEDTADDLADRQEHDDFLANLEKQMSTV